MGMANGKTMAFALLAENRYGYQENQTDKLATKSSTRTAQRWTVSTMGKWVPLGGSKNPVGWCCLHRFTLSVKQMKRKRCLVKDCRHFRKKKEHDYWKAKERAKQARKERKNNAT